MKDLHPELESINKELREITSNVDMKAAKKGGKLIKKVLKAPERASEVTKKSVETHHHHHHHHHHHYDVGHVEHHHGGSW